jgi:hypothetical protein
MIALVLVLSVASVSQVFAGKKGKPRSFLPTGIVGTISKDGIQVVGTESGSPADGKLNKGDVIVQVGGTRKILEDTAGVVKSACRRAVESDGGKLSVTLKDGREVLLQLNGSDSYGQTAPYNCATTDKVIAMAADALASELLKAKGVSAPKVELLGLMATGEKKYIDIVARRFRGGYGKMTYDGKSLQTRNSDRSIGSWDTAYATIALAEYYYLTKDETIMPALKTFTLSLVEGQDPAGLYGHKMTDPETNRAPGYGQMNQVSLACYMGMLLAKKCGVDVPGLYQALARSRAYVEFHVGRGGFAYGFHGPRDFDFNNNGTSGSAAICMALAGNKEGALFFAKMAAAAPKPGSGHASSLFSSFWSPAGANVAGPEVTKKMFPEMVKYFSGKRNWDGSIERIYNEGPLGGSLLLAYCLPRKALLITGREADESIWLDEKEAEAVVNMDHLSEGKNIAELVDLFGHENPVVRYNAVETIKKAIGADDKSLKKAAKKGKNQKTKMRAKDRKASAAREANEKQVAALFPRLQEMLKSGSLNQKRSALACYLFECPEGELKNRLDKVADVLRNKNEPDDVRVAAVRILASQPKLIEPYFDDILKFLMEDRPSDHFAWVDVEVSEAIGSIQGATRSMVAMADADANPDDPEQETEEEVVPGAEAATSKSFLGTLAKDKDLFYAASKRLMANKLQNTRGVGVRMVFHMPREDLYKVIDPLDHILKDDDRGYYSYHNPRVAKAPAAEIYAENNIREGIEYVIDNILNAPGKSSFKLMALMQTLPKYGVYAKPVIPKVMENKWVKVMYAMHENNANDRFYDQFQEMLKTIENSTTGPDLISVEDIKKEAAAQRNR